MHQAKTHPAPATQANAAANTAKRLHQDADNAQVAVPDAVDVPLHKEPADEIAVPASINGRDLSRGGP